MIKITYKEKDKNKITIPVPYGLGGVAIHLSYIGVGIWGRFHKDIKKTIGEMDPKVIKDIALIALKELKNYRGLEIVNIQLKDETFVRIVL